MHTSITTCIRAASATKPTLAVSTNTRGAEFTFGILCFVGLFARLFLDDLVNFKNYTRDSHMHTGITITQKSALLTSI